MFASWSDFFTLTGSAAATLVGLLFVVATLNTHLSKSRTLDIAHASMAPALYSFAGVLLQGMVMLVPWTTSWPRGAILLGFGFCGVLYRLDRVRVRSKLHLRAIQGPVDWMFHNAVPVLASLVLLGGGGGFIAGAAFAPFAVAGSSTLLLVSGIYRTWGETLALIGAEEGT